jgi:hypothetical protein
VRVRLELRALAVGLVTRALGAERTEESVG